jgi:hypothetical protein
MFESIEESYLGRQSLHLPLQCRHFWNQQLVVSSSSAAANKKLKLSSKSEKSLVYIKLINFYFLNSEKINLYFFIKYFTKFLYFYFYFYFLTLFINISCN